MSLKMIIGPSGSGKSDKVNNWLTLEAARCPKERFFLIVPDQFTMQTQSDLVKMSPTGGIMNIEVLSFSRLAHRVFEETGAGGKPVLDDTGKNLVLRKCAVDVKDSIPYLAGKLDKPGYIHEVKSAISEFMLYGVDDTAMNGLIDFASKGNRKTLKNKLGDLSLIYKYFKDYIYESYITTEESMDLLYSEVMRSGILRDNTVIFDGFTGFTPIQGRVLGALMKACKRVIITLSMDNVSETESVNDHDLFAFTTKSYNYIMRLARENDCKLEETECLAPGGRFASAPELAFLERNLFRYPARSYGGVGDLELQPTCQIHLDKCIDIREEITLLMHNIRKLIRDQGACYRDIAVITGNLSAYSSGITEKSREFDIPVYIDETRGIVLNPFVEYIKSAMLMFIHDFSYEYVFQYLRTGFGSLTNDEIDRLDRYVTEVGVRGSNKYLSMFTRKTSEMKHADDMAKEGKGEGSLPLLNEINGIRDKLAKEINALADGGFTSAKSRPAGEFVKSLYNFIANNGSFGKLMEYSERFKETGDFSREKEYSQIYQRTCELLEQIHDLVGDEKMNLEDFYGIIEAGFEEIEVGMIPQSVDRVIVGDMERTRLKPVKYLFFLGLNDGWVPKSGGNGGIISDSDREFLAESGTELAPTPRMQQYIGRFYLYSNLTKPSKGLYLSYVAMDGQGLSVRPSYMVEQIKKMFPGISATADGSDGLTGIETKGELHERMTSLLRKYADDQLSDEEKHMLFKLMSALSDDKPFAEQMINNAFFSYKGDKLDERIAGILYGVRLYSSISKIETYAKCAYSYFLKYGLSLNEREEYGVDAMDLGNIYHGVLEIFVKKLEERGLSWTSFDDDTATELVDEAVEEMAAKYTDAILFENEKNKFTVDRMKSLMLRTVKTLSYQLGKSEFVPHRFEYAFAREQSLGEINVGLNEEEKLYLKGKIDRLDIANKNGRILVKIVDYKSGEKDFSLLSFYHGVQLQMVVYLNEAMKITQDKNPGKEVVPAAMLYYHIDDPIYEGAMSTDDAEIEKNIIKSLRTKGLINDKDEVVSSLDNSGRADSDVIPLKLNKNGSFSKGSSVISEENMRLLTEYAEYKLKDISRSIIKGDISLNPIELRKSASSTLMDSCAYCSYKTVCGFDKNMPGYRKELIEKQADEDIIAAMKNELNP